MSITKILILLAAFPFGSWLYQSYGNIIFIYLAGLLFLVAIVRPFLRGE